MAIADEVRRAHDIGVLSMRLTDPKRASTVVREPSDSAAAAAEILEAASQSDVLAAAFREAGYDLTEVAEPGEPPHLLVVRGKGDVILAPARRDLR